MKTDVRTLRRRERISNVLSLVDNMLEVGPVRLSEIRRVCMVRLGEDPAYIDHLLKPLWESGKYTRIDGDEGTYLVNPKRQVAVIMPSVVAPGKTAEEEADEILSARPAE